MPTPISQIRRGDNQPPPMMSPATAGVFQPPPSMEGLNATGSAENLVAHEIWKDINNPTQSDINSGMYERVTDPSHIAPQQPDQMMENQIDVEYNNFISNGNEKLLSRLINTKEYPWVDYVLNISVIFMIMVLISLPSVNKLIFGVIPSLILESGQVSIHGVLLKCVIGIVLYIIFRIYI